MTIQLICKGVLLLKVQIYFKMFEQTKNTFKDTNKKG